MWKTGIGLISHLLCKKYDTLLHKKRVWAVDNNYYCQVIWLDVAKVLQIKGSHSDIPTVQSSTNSFICMRDCSLQAPHGLEENRFCSIQQTCLVCGNHPTACDVLNSFPNRRWLSQKFNFIIQISSCICVNVDRVQSNCC